MATIVMQAEQVIKAAEVVIARILKIQAEEDEDTLQKVMSIRFLGWKGFYKLNKEQAIHWINTDRDAWMGYWWSNRCGQRLQDAKSLLLIVQHGNPVVLNEKDIQVLFG